MHILKRREKNTINTMILKRGLTASFARWHMTRSGAMSPCCSHSTMSSLRWASSTNHNNDSDDPDVFRGPGGMTGRELFEKVQETVRLDKKYGIKNHPPPSDDKRTKDSASNKSNQSESSKKHSTNSSKSSTVPVITISTLPETMTIKELRSVLEEHSIDYSDCFEKQDLIERVRKYSS